MNILHASHNLVHQELDVVVGELLSLDNVVKIGAHEWSDEVDIVELGQGLGRGEDVEQPDDVLVSHVLQHPKLPIRSLRVNGGLKRPCQLLDGHPRSLVLLLGVDRAAHLAVGPRADGAQLCVAVGHLPNGLVQLDLVEVLLHRDSAFFGWVSKQRGCPKTVANLTLRSNF